MSVFASRTQKRIPWTGIAVACVGVLFCLLGESGGLESICVTAGCSLNKGFSVAGVSMWFIGAAAFALYILCALFWGAGFALWLASLYLMGDSVLLLLMSLTLPCVPCLGTAILMAAMYIATRRVASFSSRKPVREQGYGLLFACWAVFFCVNVLLVGKELTRPAPMYGPETAEIKVFFSPSCPACKEAVRLYGDAVRSGRAALYPVSESDADRQVVAAMYDAARRGLSPEEALAQALEHPDVSWQAGGVFLGWELWVNKAAVFFWGEGRIPFIMYAGLPGGLHAGPEARALPSGQRIPAAPEPGVPSPDAGGLELFSTDLQHCGGPDSGPDCLP